MNSLKTKVLYDTRSKVENHIRVFELVNDKTIHDVTVYIKIDVIAKIWMGIVLHVGGMVSLKEKIIAVVKDRINTCNRDSIHNKISFRVQGAIKIPVMTQVWIGFREKIDYATLKAINNETS